MNYISQIAKILGLEINEKFKLSSLEGNFHFTEKKLIWTSPIDGQEYGDNSSLLADVLLGEKDIIKLPWLPKHGDTYWHITKMGTADRDRWTGMTYDYILYQFGNCFKTEDEAIKHIQEITDKIFKGVEK